MDDLLCFGVKEGGLKCIYELKRRFDTDDVGELDEYVGFKINHDKEKRSIRFTQPVMIQSFHDEFELPNGRDPVTPAEENRVLVKCAEEHMLNKKDQKTYRSGVGKLLHMMRWSRPEILNSVRELSRFMSGASKAHLKAMLRLWSM